MRRSIRNRLLITAAILAALYGVAVVAVEHVSTDALRERVAHELSDALALDVAIGALEVTLWPTPRLEAGDVRVARRSDPPVPPLLSIARIDLVLELWPLLARTAVVDALELEGAELLLDDDDVRALAASFDSGAAPDDGADDDGVRLDLRRLDVRALRVSYRDAAAATEGAVRTLEVDALRIESDGPDGELSVDARGRLDGADVAVSGRIGSLHELVAPTGPYPVDLRGRLFEADVEAKGTVRDPRTFSGVDLAVTASIPEVVVDGRPLPELGALHATGTLSDGDGSLGLEHVVVGGEKGGPVEIDLRGDVGDVLALEGIDVEGRVDAASLDFLAPLVGPQSGIPLPPLASLAAHARMTDRGGSLRVDGSVEAATHGDAVVLHAEGTATHLARSPRIDVRLDARADDLASVTALFPELTRHDPLGPVTAKARLVRGGGALGLEAIDVHVGTPQTIFADATGEIADVERLRGVALELTFGAASLHHLRELLARELPQTSPFSGALGISDRDGSLGVEHLRLHGGEDSPVEIHLDARFDDLPARDEIELELALRGRDARVLGAIAGLDLPPVGPVELGGAVHGSAEHVDVEHLALRLGESRVAGSASGSYAPPARPRVEARLASTRVRLEDFGLAPAVDGVPRTEASAPRDRSAPLPFETLRQVDLDLEVRFDHVGGAEGFAADDVHFDVKLDDGDLRVTDATATYQDGHFQGAFRANARTPVPAVEVSVSTLGMNLAKVMAQFQAETEYSGIVDGDLELSAHGRTRDALRASLAGRVTASMRDGNAAYRIAREFVVDLVKNVFRGVRPPEVPRIGCGVADLEIEDGVATVHTLFLKEDELSVSATGRIDLVRGRYDLRVVPEARNPGVVSVAPEVVVTGPLDDPHFRAVKRTLLSSFGRGLLHNATSAVGTLFRPLLPSRGDAEATADPCGLSTRSAS